MIRLLPKTSLSADYYLQDPANELEGIRVGPAGYFLRGDGPIDVDILRNDWRQPPRSRVLGYDLVVAAPRPISILLAVGTESEQRALVEGHRLAVRSALAYLEEEGLSVRASVGSERFNQRSRWGQIVAFTHGINRAVEPHLHDHVLLASVPAHRRTALDRRALSLQLVATDAIYRSELRAHLNRTLQRQVWRSFRGDDHLSGIDEGMRALWPGTRSFGSEKVRLTRKEVVERWAVEVQGFEPVKQLVPPAKDQHVLDEHTFAAHFEGVFDVGRADVITAVANAMPFGATRSQIEAFVQVQYPEFAERSQGWGRRISVQAARGSGVILDGGAPRVLPTPNLQLVQRDREPPSERSRQR